MVRAGSLPARERRYRSERGRPGQPQYVARTDDNHCGFRVHFVHRWTGREIHRPVFAESDTCTHGSCALALHTKGLGVASQQQ